MNLTEKIIAQYNSSTENARVFSAVEAQSLISRSHILHENNIKEFNSYASLSDSQILEIAEATINSLPAKLRNKIGKSGSPAMFWAGDNIFKDRRSFKVADIKVRGAAVLAQYLRQNGLDAYTLINNISIFDMDVDHVVPVSRGGLDEPSNWVLTRGGLNQLRGNKTLADFVQSAVDWVAMSAEEKEAYIKRQAEAKLKNSVIKKIEYNKIIDSSYIVADGGKQLEAQAVHNLGTKTWGRMAKVSESAGRGASNMPTALRKALVKKSLELRLSKYQNFKAGLSGYSKSMTSDEFRVFYSKFYSKTPDRVLKKIRTEQHNNGANMNVFLNQDAVTNLINEELITPYRKIREARINNFKKGAGFDVARREEAELVASQLISDGIDAETVTANWR